MQRAELEKLKSDIDGALQSCPDGTAFREVLEQSRNLLFDYEILKDDHEAETIKRRELQRLARSQGAAVRVPPPQPPQQPPVSGHPYVLVLINGDEFHFGDEYSGARAKGGAEAARKLTSIIQGNDLYQIAPKCPIVIYVYANLISLSKALNRERIIGAEKRSFSDFVAGFTSACEFGGFMDVGEEEKATRKKLQRTIESFGTSSLCEQIFLADTLASDLLNPSIARSKVAFITVDSLSHQHASGDRTLSAHDLLKESSTRTRSGSKSTSTLSVRAAAHKSNAWQATPAVPSDQQQSMMRSTWSQAQTESPTSPWDRRSSREDGFPARSEESSAGQSRPWQSAEAQSQTSPAYTEESSKRPSFAQDDSAQRNGGSHISGGNDYDAKPQTAPSTSTWAKVATSTQSQARQASPKEDTSPLQIDEWGDTTQKPADKWTRVQRYAADEWEDDNNNAKVPDEWNADAQDNYATEDSHEGGSRDNPDFQSGDGKQGMIPVNRYDERVDPHIPGLNDEIWKRYTRHREMTKGCNDFYLLGSCQRANCEYDHGEIDPIFVKCMRAVQRKYPCNAGGRCRYKDCLSAHHCTIPGCVGKRSGLKCKLPESFHGIDANVHEYVEPESKPAHWSNADSRSGGWGSTYRKDGSSRPWSRSGGSWRTPAATAPAFVALPSKHGVATMTYSDTKTEQSEHKDYLGDIDAEESEALYATHRMDADEGLYAS